MKLRTKSFHIFRDLERICVQSSLSICKNLKLFCVWLYAQVHVLNIKFLKYIGLSYNECIPEIECSATSKYLIKNVKIFSDFDCTFILSDNNENIKILSLISILVTYLSLKKVKSFFPSVIIFNFFKIGIFELT